MNIDTNKKITPLSRTSMTFLYAVDFVVLCYFLYGAYHGQLLLPSNHGLLALTGWKAWLTCLFPVSFIAGFAIGFDPAIELPDGVRRVLMFLILMAGGMSLVVPELLAVSR
ncbi:MAG: hypothetical protein ABIP34_19865 [Rhodoferax sp.]|uniref:hypothetical protein n=1 Tax=Rhodoferax sp. TaxID=50421 RepID=UPI0032653D9A